MSDHRNVRHSWRMRCWLVRMEVKAHLAAGVVKAIAGLARWIPQGWLWVRLPRLLRGLPASWRGRDYSLCQQNLTALGFEPALATAMSCRFSALQWQRAVNERRYPREATALRRWIKGVTWRDPYAAVDPGSPSLYLLTHTGEYWMAVASLMARHSQPTRFVIPIWNFADPFTRQALRALEGLGHRVDVLDVAAPTTALAMARALKQGDRVMLFCDLPVSLGAVRFGEPLPGRLFDRPAQFVRGPLFLAAKMGYPAVLIGHRACLGGKGEVQVLEHLPVAPLAVMQVRWMQGLERHLSAAPEQWLYLPRLEAFYHQQRNTAGMQGLSIPRLGAW
jgi:hypothetical protein